MALEESMQGTTEISQPDAPEDSRAPGKTKKPRQGQGSEEEAGSPRPQARIEGLTKAGHQALLLGNSKEALAAFQEAFALCLDTPSRRAQKACAFNLGAAYVEAGEPEKGLAFLLQLRPEDGEAPEHTGDLCFNLGVAHKALQDFPAALESFRKARDHYCTIPGDSGANSAAQMAHCYLGMEDAWRAAQCFLEASRGYETAGSLEAAATALHEAGKQMLRDERLQLREIVQVLSECGKIAEQIPNRAFCARLHSDIGLGFSQLKIFSLAVESFEKALLLGQAEGGDRHKEATVLQNLGAAHNSLGNFRMALNFHQRAAWLQGALGNRRAQGQCFCNLAYALSQLDEHEAAGENYLHALQAFKESDDLQGQGQACEGLGASHFLLGDPGKAAACYKEALTLISECQEGSGTTQGRIVDKLTHALQLKFSGNSPFFHGARIRPAAPLTACATGPLAQPVGKQPALAQLNSGPQEWGAPAQAKLGHAGCGASGGAAGPLSDSPADGEPPAAPSGHCKPLHPSSRPP